MVPMVKGTRMSSEALYIHDSVFELMSSCGTEGMASASEFLNEKDEYRSGEIDESIVEMFEKEADKKKKKKRGYGRNPLVMYILVVLG